MRPQSAAGEYAEKLCKEFPKASTRLLARMLFKEYNTHFKSEMTARNMIKIYRGEHSSSSNMKKDKLTPRYQDIRAAIPEPIMETRKKWAIQEIEIVKALIIADVHVPFHDADALALAIEYAVKDNCRDIIVLGDFFDMYQFSRFEKDPNLRTTKEEIKSGRAILAYLAKTFKGNKIFKLGNHDERYYKWIADNAPMLLDLDEFSFTEVCGLKDWQVIGDKQPIKAGDLNLIHGHEYKGGFVSPVNPARGMFIKGFECIASAHQHQPSQHTARTIGGKAITCYSIGCLCHLNPQYMPLNQWGHGFAILTMEEGGFHFENKRIINGRVY